MNPIKNKKDLETTIEELRNFAYAYLEKYSPSKQQLKTYLFKKFIRRHTYSDVRSARSVQDALV